jgi:hypothetical protein
MPTHTYPHALDTLTNKPVQTPREDTLRITRRGQQRFVWSSRAGGSCVAALLPCPCRLCPCLVTCTRAGPSAAPTPLSSPLVLSWRLAFSRPSHSPSALMGPPVHGPSKRLQGRVCLGAWRGREGGSGAGPQLGFAQLGFAQERGFGSSDGVWGADWAAVVSPSPRDEASAKQVLPWRDRHGPLKASRSDNRQPWAPLCVSGWSHGCAVQPLQRPVTVGQCTTHQRRPKCRKY